MHLRLLDGNGDMRYWVSAVVQRSLTHVEQQPEGMLTGQLTQAKFGLRVP